MSASVNPVSNPSVAQVKYAGRLSATPSPNLMFELAAEKHTLPNKSTSTMDFRTYLNTGLAQTPLDPTGINNAPVDQGISDVQATINAYGQWTSIMETVEAFNEEEVLMGITKTFGIALRSTHDANIRDTLVASSSVWNAVGGVNNDNPTNPARSDFDAICAEMDTNDARTILDPADGSEKFDTTTLRDAYLGFGHSRLRGSLDAVTGFQQKAAYGYSGSTIRPEYGSVSNVRVCLSSLGKIIPNASLLGNDVYVMPIVGQSSYACVKQDKLTTNWVYRDPKVVDVYGRRATVAWILYNAYCNLKDEWIYAFRMTLLNAA